MRKRILAGSCLLLGVLSLEAGAADFTTPGPTSPSLFPPDYDPSPGLKLVRPIAPSLANQVRTIVGGMVPIPGDVRKIKMDPKDIYKQYAASVVLIKTTWVATEEEIDNLSPDLKQKAPREEETG
jgi:hypothetical protein